MAFVGGRRQEEFLQRLRAVGAARTLVVGVDVGKRAEARAQWIAVFGRDWADLGPGHAAELAAREAARDCQDRSRHRTAAARPRPVSPVPSVPRPEAERRGPSLARGGAAPRIGR